MSCIATQRRVKQMSAEWFHIPHLGHRLIDLFLAELLTGHLAIPVQIQHLEELFHNPLRVDHRVVARQPGALLAHAAQPTELVAFVAFRALVVRGPLSR